MKMSSRDIPLQQRTAQRQSLHIPGVVESHTQRVILQRRAQSPTICEGIKAKRSERQLGCVCDPIAIIVSAGHESAATEIDVKGVLVRVVARDVQRRRPRPGSRRGKTHGKGGAAIRAGDGRRGVGGKREVECVSSIE